MTRSEVTIQRTALLESAIHYGQRGWAVFPVHSIERGRCSCGQTCNSPGKHPRTTNGLLDATTDANRVREWWTRWPDANLAVRTGLTFWTLEVDPDNGGSESLAALLARHGSLPETVEAVTGGGGRHVLFAQPAGVNVPNSVGTLGPGLDVRGTGGYIVAAPSRHRSGRRYEWEAAHHPDETPLAPAPSWLLERILTPPATASAPAYNRSAEDWAARLRGVPEGQRHRVLTEMVGHYLGLRIPAVEVEAIMLLFAARCQPPLDAVDVRRVRGRAGRPRRFGAGEAAGPADQGAALAAASGAGSRTDFAVSLPRAFPLRVTLTKAKLEQPAVRTYPATAYSGIPVRTLLRLIKDGHLRRIKVPGMGRVRLDRLDLDALLERWKAP